MNNIFTLLSPSYPLAIYINSGHTISVYNGYSTPTRNGDRYCQHECRCSCSIFPDRYAVTPNSDSTGSMPFSIKLFSGLWVNGIILCPWFTDASHYKIRIQQNIDFRLCQKKDGEVVLYFFIKPAG